MEPLKQTADAILEEGIKFTVKISNPTLWQRLRSQTEKTFIIYPANMGTMIRISRELLNINIDNFDPKKLFESNYKLISDQGHGMARIIALAVTNNRSEPPESLVTFFESNLTASNLNKIANTVILQLDLVNFLRSIISLKGINILSETNPQSQRS